MGAVSLLAKENQRRVQKERARILRHGKDWRGIIDHYNFMCANCGSIIGLELHEPFGRKIGSIMVDTKEGTKYRVLLCRTCHSESEDHIISVFSPTRGRRSTYLEDIQAEIADCGSYAKWKILYNVGFSLK